MIERPLFGGAITCQLPAHWRDLSVLRQVPDHQECWLDDDGDDDCINNSNDDCKNDGDGHTTNGTGAVCVVEILEHQASIADPDAARFFLDDLAQANGSSHHETTTGTTPVSVGTARCCCHHHDIVCVFGYGTQRIPHSNGTTGTSSSSNSSSTTPTDSLIRLCIAARETSDSSTTSRTTTRMEQLDYEDVAIHLAVLRLPQHATDILVTLSIPLKEQRNTDDNNDDCCTETAITNGYNTNTHVTTTGVVGDAMDMNVPTTTALFESIVMSIQIRDWSLFG